MQPPSLCSSPHSSYAPPPLARRHNPSNPPLHHPNPFLPPILFPSMAISLLRLPAPLLLSKVKALYPFFAATPAPDGCGMPANCLMKCLRDPFCLGCGLLRFSKVVFWGIRKPDLVSWTCMLTGLVKNGHEDEVLMLLEQMLWAGILFDAYVLSIGLTSANLNCVGSGKQIHSCLVKYGLDSNCFLRNSLLEFYGRVGELGLMRMLFDRMIERDLVAWNTMISCYVCSLFDVEALMLFHEMIKRGFVCDDFSLGSILQAVTSQGALSHGKEIHGSAIRAGFEFNCHVNSAILDMYIKCSNCELIFFQSIGAEFDDFIISSILKFCASQKDLETGKVIHSCILKLGMNSDPFVMISLIDVYAKCGLIRTSISMFARIVEPSDVSWSAIIAGLCFNGHFHEALELFRAMQFHCIKANEFTYTSVVLACLAEGKNYSGREIQCSIIRHGYGYHACHQHSDQLLHRSQGTI